MQAVVHYEFECDRFFVEANAGFDYRSSFVSKARRHPNPTYPPVVLTAPFWFGYDAGVEWVANTFDVSIRYKHPTKNHRRGTYNELFSKVLHREKASTSLYRFSREMDSYGNAGFVPIESVMRFLEILRENF